MSNTTSTADLLARFDALVTKFRTETKPRKLAKYKWVVKEYPFVRFRRTRSASKGRIEFINNMYCLDIQWSKIKLATKEEQDLHDTSVHSMEDFLIWSSNCDERIVGDVLSTMYITDIRGKHHKFNQLPNEERTAVRDAVRSEVCKYTLKYC